MYFTTKEIAYITLEKQILSEKQFKVPIKWLIEDCLFLHIHCFLCKQWLGGVSHKEKNAYSTENIYEL